MAQFATSADKGANRDAALARVAEAAGRGAELLVLPEAAMCTFGGPTADLTSVAEPLDGPFVTALQRAAAEGGLTVVAGTFEPSGRPGKVRNTVVAVGPDGLVGAYRKLHLYDAHGWRESDRVEAGDPQDDNLVVFGLGDLVFGLMTCYDLRFPEMARALSRPGGDGVGGAGPLAGRAGEGRRVGGAAPGQGHREHRLCGGGGQARPRGHRPVHGRRSERPGAGGPGRRRGGGWPWPTCVADRVGEVRAELPVLAHRRFDVAPRR